MDLTVVVPLYNEEENIRQLYSELKGVISKLDLESEVIFIDDGSKDKTLELLTQIQAEDPCVTVISFRKNFGQTPAIAAGFNHAKGDVIITMDGDLQNDPADIPKLLAKIAEGYDMVNGWRFDRKDKFMSRRLPSIIANKVISFTTNVKLHDYGCTLKAFRKEVADELRLYGEMHRFIPAIASTMGVDMAEVKVNHRPRKFGTSKYGISRTIRVILDLITVKFLLSYSTRPIQLFGLMGVASGGAGFLLALYLTFQRQYMGIGLTNRPILLLAILLIFIGLQFITLGLLAELQSRTYHESQNKPVYAIRKIFTSSDNTGAGLKNSLP
jgi:glycosyltransferase involved in cell wall biosynthesis